jgi:hypothetical protein
MEIYDPEISITGEKALIEFVQLLHTEDLSDIGRKRMALMRTTDTWKIKSENFEALVGYLRLSPEEKIDLSLTDLGSLPEDGNREKSAFSSTSDDLSLRVLGIKYQLVKKGVESVCIECNRRFTPSVHAVEGDEPRIFIDLHIVAEIASKARIPLKTSLIRGIRLSHNSIDQRLRVVLDVAPGDNYTVEPVFFDPLKTFCLGVKASNQPPLRRTDVPRPKLTIEKPD